MKSLRPRHITPLHCDYLAIEINLENLNLMGTRGKKKGDYLSYYSTFTKRSRLKLSPR